MQVFLARNEQADVANLLNGILPSGKTFDPDMEKFLREFFTSQSINSYIADGQPPVDPDLDLFEIKSEGEGWIEIKACNRTIVLKRRVGGPGRARVNPYIDTRQLNGASVAFKRACYAAASYMLKKDGLTNTEDAQAQALREFRARLFSGKLGSILLQHMSYVVREVHKRVDKLPGDTVISTQDIVTRAFMQAVLSSVDANYKKNLAGGN